MGRKDTAVYGLRVVMAGSATHMAEHRAFANRSSNLCGGCCLFSPSPDMHTEIPGIDSMDCSLLCRRLPQLLSTSGKWRVHALSMPRCRRRSLHTNNWCKPSLPQRLAVGIRQPRRHPDSYWPFGHHGHTGLETEATQAHGASMHEGGDLTVLMDKVSKLLEDSLRHNANKEMK